MYKPHLHKHLSISKRWWLIARDSYIHTFLATLNDLCYDLHFWQSSCWSNAGSSFSLTRDHLTLIALPTCTLTLVQFTCCGFTQIRAWGLPVCGFTLLLGFTCLWGLLWSVHEFTCQWVYSAVGVYLMWISLISAWVYLSWVYSVRLSSHPFYLL